MYIYFEYLALNDVKITAGVSRDQVCLFLVWESVLLNKIKTIDNQIGRC